MSGFVAVSRDMLRHPLFEGEPQRVYAWMWLISNAAWRPVPFDVGGKIITIQRGQVCASIRQLAEEWGMSKSSAERFVTRLKTETMIETEAGHGKLVITLCNYEKYQHSGDTKRDASRDSGGTAAGRQRDIKEQGNKGTRVKEKEKARAETLIPDGWMPAEFGEDTKSRKIVDSWPPGVLEHQIEHFIAHHVKKGDKFKDWQAAWSTWVLNSRNFKNGAANRRNHQAQAGSRDGFLNACFDAAMGGNGTGDPFGRAASQARSDSAPAFPEIATSWNG